jgi:hypothetical protein
MMGTNEGADTVDVRVLPQVQARSGKDQNTKAVFYSPYG